MTDFHPSADCTHEIDCSERSSPLRGFFETSPSTLLIVAKRNGYRDKDGDASIGGVLGKLLRYRNRTCRRSSP
jgi:hypothetical protein